MREFDDLVVGGGSAGCVIAARLVAAGRSVCLVEAGPDYGPFADGRWPADILDGRWLALSHSWETEREDRSQLRARILGGCSAHNACVALRGAPADYDEWGHGWSHAVLEPYLERAERVMGVRRLADEELSPWHAAWSGASGAVVHPVNLADGALRWNAAFAYVDPAREGLTIVADTLVDRVLLDGDRAVGVVTAGSEPAPTAASPDGGELRAGRVILCAGAYGTPGILLRSGFGPPVGEELIDHVGVGLAFEPTEQLTRETRAFEAGSPLCMAGVTVEACSSTCGSEGCDTFLFPSMDVAPDGAYEISAAAFAMKPFSRGSVRLTSPDPRAPLAIDHGFLSDERDLAVVAEGVEAVRALVASSPASAYAAREIRPGPDVAAADHVRAAVRGFFHPVGTCAIGRVVDGEGRVRGVDGLRVADASIIPTIPRANTNLTTIAVAERLAELMTTA